MLNSLTALMSARCAICLYGALFSVMVATSNATQPPAILLANVLGENVDPAAYLVSEKYDGVRAIWDSKAP